MPVRPSQPLPPLPKPRPATPAPAPRALAYGSRDRDYDTPDPGAGARGPVRRLQADLAALGHFSSPHGLTGGYFSATTAAARRFQRAEGLPASGRADLRTLEALRARRAGGPEGAAPVAPGPAPVAPRPAPAADAWVRTTAPAGGPMQGAGTIKEGQTIPRWAGRATTFWNGHLAYKGQYDKCNRQNGGLGAWGDKCAPTDYFCALPVGLKGGGKWWHNQKILVTNPATGRQVVVRVQDKGPAPRTGAAIDLSPVAMEALGGKFNGSLGHVKFEFAPADAPVGPVM